MGWASRVKRVINRKKDTKEPTLETRIEGEWLVKIDKVGQMCVEPKDHNIGAYLTAALVGLSPDGKFGGKILLFPEHTHFLKIDHENKSMHVRIDFVGGDVNIFDESAFEKFMKGDLRGFKEEIISLDMQLEGEWSIVLNKRGPVKIASPVKVVPELTRRGPQPTTDTLEDYLIAAFVVICGDQMRPEVPFFQILDYSLNDYDPNRKFIDVRVTRTGILAKQGG